MVGEIQSYGGEMEPELTLDGDFTLRDLREIVEWFEAQLAKEP